LVALEPSAAEELPPVSGLPEHLAPAAGVRLIAHVPVGELDSAQLSDLANFATQWGAGFLMATVDQDIAFHLPEESDPEEAAAALQRISFGPPQITFRVCPGNHQCLAGLSPTRDIARTVIESMGPTAQGLSWALSGCHNSCTQPQLADVGIVSATLVKDEAGERTPRFDLYRGGNQGFGTATEHSLTLDELRCKVQEIG
jgi:ferredoxin-nitrite reductase